MCVSLKCAVIPSDAASVSLRLSLIVPSSIIRRECGRNYGVFFRRNGIVRAGGSKRVPSRLLCGGLGVLPNTNHADDLYCCEVVN